MRLAEKNSCNKKVIVSEQTCPTLVVKLVVFFLVTQAGYKNIDGITSTKRKEF
jgi:hypothetical protein